MVSTDNKERKELTTEERRERRRLRREKQRKENIGRAARCMPLGCLRKLAVARIPLLFEFLHLCRLLRMVLLEMARTILPRDLPTGEWFGHYAKQFNTVEINASFYSWPTVANVKSWLRQPGNRKFVYTVKVCELITHIKRFKGTKTLVKDFGHDRRYTR